MIKKYFVAFIAMISLNTVIAQKKDTTKSVDLFAELENESKKVDANTTDFATATFKSTRIVNGHSIETIGKNNLDFRIAHRFGYVNSGSKNLFGLDEATMRIGLDYGVTNNLMIGFGRTTIDKELDAFVKYKLLRQSTGKCNMPISLTFFGGIYHYTKATTEDITATNRTSYVTQLLIARKFNDAFSFQLSPTWVHLNLVDLAKEKNDLLSLGISGRVKISKRVAITGDYYHQFNKLQGRTNSLSLGFDIETGGHVFQLHVTNSIGMNERHFITNTTGDWGDGGIRFGFNITRLFVLKKAAGSRAGW
jgi:hypothetical protein